MTGDCEVITSDGVCGDTATLRERHDEHGRRMELYLCDEHWQLWLDVAASAGGTP